jgi:pimeloyl-ACP methyl ester carboxylesterase
MNADRRRSLGTLLGAMLTVFCVSPLAATPVPPGKWSFIWKDAKGRPDRPMRVYTYRPRTCDASCPMVIVMHGLKRNASDYRDYWELAADRYKLLVVAPEFTRENWPRAASYNLGEVGIQSDREKWAFSAIEHLFDEMRVDQQTYVLFGHSAGGQFAQRMALFRPDNRAAVIVAANPGWYTMPEWRKEKVTAPFPYSLVGSPSGEAELRKALARRLVLLVGEKDDDPDDENLNKSEGAMKQGATRVERAENFFKAATTAANDLGVKFAWELDEAPDVAHSGSTMSKIAADTVYGKK